LIRAIGLAGCAVAMLLVGATLLAYPGNPATAGRNLAYGAIALGLLVAVAGSIAWGSARFQAGTDGFAFRWGALVGAVLGLAWVVEISFNNFVPPAISVPARGWVDNGIWAAIGLATVGLGAWGTRRTGRVATGVWLGVWSGLASGLIACLMGLLLIVAAMPFLLRDPYNLAEWAARGAASGAPDLPTYLAYETLAGAIGHLVALGIVAGALLGGGGGLVGRGLWRLRWGGPVSNRPLQRASKSGGGRQAR
jgi:hypothetical protein